MVNIIKQEVVIEESLKKKLELICKFSNTTLKIINGSIRKIDRTNLTYVEPHRIIINDITFLAFNYSNEIFIENLSNKIKLSELEDYLKKLISFLHDKLHSWYDKDDKYIDVVNDMYNYKVLDDDDIEEFNLNKEKDDFER